MKVDVLAEPVLVGRERELGELMSCLDSAVAGKGRTVFVSGEAGSGKTRLADEFLFRVQDREVALLSSWCLSDVATPYLPFMQAFNSYFTVSDKNESDGVTGSGVQHRQFGLEGEEIKAWLAGPKQAARGERFQNLTPQAWQDLAVAAVTKALTDLSARRTVVLFIDDLQWADSASLSLLHYISRSIESARILVLATYRSEELTPGEEGRPHPLLETLRQMRREGLLKEIKLSNLDEADVVTLAEKMVGGGLHPEFRSRLSKESQGNPLFVIESLRMLSEHESLVQDCGLWRLSIDEVGIPAKIKDIILRRVDMLKPSQRRVLDLASVIGERFDVELLGAVLGQDSLEVLETLNAVAQSSSLVCSKGFFFEFDHAKSREAIYEQISPPLKRGYHARIAEKIENRVKDSKKLPVNDLAYHYLQAGNKGQGVKYALAAAEDALARFSNAEAAKQFAYVLSTIGDASDCDEVRESALEGLGDALSASGLVADAMKTYDKLGDVAKSGAVKLRALRKSLVSSWWADNRAHCGELGIKAEQYQQFDRLEYGRLRLYRGFFADRVGKTREAFEDLDAALKIFEEEYSIRDVARALAEMVISYLGQGRSEEQLSAALRSISLFEELEDSRGQLLARSRLDWPLRNLGLYDEVLKNTKKGAEIGEKIGDYNTTALLLWGSSTVYDLRGDYRAAVDQTLKALKYAEKTSAYMTLRLCYGMLAREYAKLGEIERAEEFEEKREELYVKWGGQTKNEVADNTFSKALISLAKGQWNEANKFFEEFFRKEDTLWGSGKEIANRNDYAWALEKQGRKEEAKIQLEIASKIREREAKNAEKIEHANVLAFFLAQRETGVGEELNVRLDLVNVAKKPALLVKVEELSSLDFKVTNLPSYCSLSNGSILFNGRELEAFSVLPLKLGFQARVAGVFTLTPKVTYVDDMGQTRTSTSRTVTITVQPRLHVKIGEQTVSVPVLPKRQSTGYSDLDALLYGGFPEKYAIVLTAPSVDERALLVKSFLGAGVDANEPTFYVTSQVETVKALAELHTSSFQLVLCNLQSGAMIENLPNVFKLKGTENLTEIDIALAKAFRALKSLSPSPRRICIDIVSDVLLQHHAIVTRKWLTGLLPNLKSQGFTVLALINPGMHSQEELQAIVELFDGEISISEKETVKGVDKVLRICRLFNQKYLENEILLRKSSRTAK